MSIGRCVDAQKRRAEAIKDCEIAQEVDGFTRHLSITPGYDHRAFPEDCGGGGHGCHGMDLRFVLVGPEGAVQWLAFLTQFTPTAPISRIGSVEIAHPSLDETLMPADLGYHWPTARYEGQESRECEYLPGGHCYYDGSGLAAEEIVLPFLTDGPAGVWRELRAYYDRLVGDPDVAGGFGAVIDVLSRAIKGRS